MPKRKIQIVFVSIVFIFGILYLVNSIDDSEPNFLRTLDENPESFERNVSEVSYQSSYLADTSSVFRPAQIRLYNGSVYLNDFSNFTIYEYDQEGNQKRKLTTSQGRGPGGILHLTDFDILDDIIWIADSQNMRVTSYSLETGENINNFSLENRPMRITCLKDEFIDNGLVMNYSLVNLIMMEMRFTNLEVLLKTNTNTNTKCHWMVR